MKIGWKDRGEGLHQAYTPAGGYIGYVSRLERYGRAVGTIHHWSFIAQRYGGSGATKRLDEAKKAVERNWARFLRTYGLTEATPPNFDEDILR